MESGTLPGSSPAHDEVESQDPRDVAAKAAGAGERGRELIEHAAMGAELDAEEENAALDWLLGTPAATVHEVEVDYETPRGMAKLKFVYGRVDARKIDAVEQRFVNERTGRVDQIGADIAVVAEFCTELVDATGNRLDLKSSRFRTVKARNKETGEVTEIELASPAEALEKRMGDQLGLLGGVAREIRRTAGFDPQRVGSAQRRLVEGSLG